MASKFDITTAEPIAEPGRFAVTETEPIAEPVAMRFGGIGLPEPAATEGTERLSDSIMEDILFGPDKMFNPLEQGQIATELLERLSEPADSQRRFENRAMISTVFGVPWRQVEFMERDMLKKLFEDDLISLKERFKKNPVEGGFFKKIGEAVRRGDRNVTSDIAVYQAAFENKGDIDEVLRTRAKHQLEEVLNPIEGNLISNLFYKSGQIVPGMVRGYWDAIPEAFAGMATGITVAAIAGQAGPQVLLPEEVLTVPIGAVTGLKIGLSAGSAHFWYKQGAGSFFAAMQDKGLDPEISRTVAGVAAIPYAIVELLQVSQLTPGLRKGAEDIGRRTMLKVIAQATKTYGKTYTQEVLEEIAQEIIQISAEDIAEYLSENGIEINAQFIQERANRVWVTAKESAQALALLPIPGAVIDVNTGRKQVLIQKRIDTINAKTAEFEQALGSILTDNAKREVEAAAEGGIAKPEPTLAVPEAGKPAVVTPGAEITRPEPSVKPEIEAKPLVAKEVTAEKDLAEGKVDTIAKHPKVIKANQKLVEVDRRRGLPSDEGGFATQASGTGQFTKANQAVGNAIREVASELGLEITTQDNINIRTILQAQAPAEVTEGKVSIKELQIQANRLALEEVGERPTGIQAEFAQRQWDTKFLKAKTKHYLRLQKAQAAQPVTAEEVIPEISKEKRVISKEARIIEERVASKKIKDLQENITELEKLQAENKAREGTTQFDPEFDKFATKQIEKTLKKIEQIKIGKPVVTVGKKILGLTRAEIELLTPQQQKELRLEQARGAKVGFRAGEAAARERAKTEVLKFVNAKKITEGRRDAARKLVMEFVPQEFRGEFLFSVTRARTEKDVRKIAEAIEKGIARLERRDAIEDLRDAARAITPKKMLPEFAKTAKSILDSLQIGKIRLDTMIRNSDLKEMAQQVLDTSREDSVAAVRAQQLLEELREKTSKTFAVNQLSVDAISQITDTLIALRFQNELDTIAAKDENATEAIRRRDEIKKDIKPIPDVPESLGGKQVKKFKLFHDNMESVLDAVSGARAGTYDLWKETKRATTEFIYDVLNKGVDEQIIQSEKSRNIFRQILVDNKVAQKDILNWSMRPEDISKVKKAFGFAPKPQIHKFTLEDAREKPKEFEFTTNELMTIFMHFGNNYNLEVLLKDGMDRIIDGKKQKIRGFDIEKIEEMVNSLTEQQKKVARQVGSKLMDGFNKDSINKTSVRLEFFELAKVDRYWPARRSITRIIRGRKLAGTVKTVEGMGLLKERVGIGNPMKLIGFFETVYATNKNVAAYVGLAEPLREVKAVYSKDTIEELENEGRAKEANLITDLIERFEGQSTLIGPLDTIIKRMLGGFAKAKLFLRPKIAVRQQISSFLISAYVDTKYITEFRGVGTKKLTEEIGELSPQMKARFEQLQFDRDIGDAFIENEIMNYLTGKTELIDKTAIGLRFFDKNAIIDVYRAVKAEVIDKNPDINIDSKEGKILLKDRFEWVVRHTQPMWHPKDRSLIGSDPRPLIRSLTMFMSQREQLVRMVNNGVADYINSKKTIEDATRLGRTLGTVAMNLAAFTLYNFAWAVLIHKKKKDILDLGKFFLNDILSLPFFGKYVARSFEITFNLLAGKPVFQRSFDEGPIEGILGRILLEAIPNFALAGKHFVTKERYQSGPNRGKEKWAVELFVAIDALVDAVASLKGRPYYGAKELVRSVKAQLPDEEKPVPKIIGR